MSEELNPIYYMRDNHTFKRLSADVDTAIVEIEGEFNAGYTYGMLCSKRPGFKKIHAQGDAHRFKFFTECKKALESLAQRPAEQATIQDPLTVAQQATPEPVPDQNTIKNSTPEPVGESVKDPARLHDIVWECIYDHGNGKFRGQASKEQRQSAQAALARLLEAANTRPAPSVPEDVQQLVRELVKYIERNTCTHEETHRGGVIWEICDACGSMWADDEGGKPEFVWPEVVEQARTMLAAAQAKGGQA